MDACTHPASRRRHATLIRGEGPLVRGEGPVRTGVTAILPRGRTGPDSVFAAWFTLNGNGEMTGTTWLEESGILEGPIAITNTHSVGVVRDAIVAHAVEHGQIESFLLPIAAETYDGWLSDIDAFHITQAHALAALGNIPLTGDETRIILEEGVGPVPVRIRSRNGALKFLLAEPREIRPEGRQVHLPFGPRQLLEHAARQQMGGDAPLMAQILTLQTLIAIVTMPVAIALGSRALISGETCR